MKKIISIAMIFAILFTLVFSMKVYADTLDTLNISIDKSTVHPGENITVTINFGTDLTAYTFDIYYDKKLVEYVSSEGSTQTTPSDEKVRVYYLDSTGGSQPRQSMTATFKAKTEGITTSNPTNFRITAEGLTKPDTSKFDNITDPKIQTFTVEPIFVDYAISLNYEGDVIVNEEKDMRLSIASTMGKNYEHARIEASATSDVQGTAKLLATDGDGQTQYDIIESGWGDPAGELIGGENVNKVLNVRGLFSKAGNYTVTVKLIDRDESDETIISKAFQIAVKEKTTSGGNGNSTQTPGQTNTQGQTSTGTNNQTPSTLPKTGDTIYLAVVPIIAILVASYIFFSKKK